MEKKLLECIAHFGLVDLLGFARLLGVEEKETAEDFIAAIVNTFSNLPRKKRKEFLKLAQDVSEENMNAAASLMEMEQSAAEKS